MEMKDFQIVVDLKDLYTESGDYEYGYSGDEKDFNETIKDEIQSKVIDHIVKGFTSEVRDKLKKETEEKFKERFEQKIGDRVEKAIERGVLVKPDGSTFSVDDLAREKMQYVISDSRFMSQLEKKVKEQIEEMHEALQRRYDLAFASGIIKNLKEGNLLKDGAEKLLLNNEE